jgi:hypothetical protein
MTEPEQGYLYRAEAGASKVFCWAIRRAVYWRYLDGGYGNAGMRPERRTSGRKWRGSSGCPVGRRMDPRCYSLNRLSHGYLSAYGVAQRATHDKYRGACGE